MNMNQTFSGKWIEGAWTKCFNINATSPLTTLELVIICALFKQTTVEVILFFCFRRMLVSYHFSHYDIDLIVSIGRNKNRYVLTLLLENFAWSASTNNIQDVNSRTCKVIIYLIWFYFLKITKRPIFFLCKLYSQ